MRLIPYCAGLAYLSFFSPRDAKRANLLLLVVFHVLLAIPAPQQGRDLLRATFLYVGDGDAAVLGMPGGQTILVDAGPDTEGQGWSQSPVVSFLAIEGINRIDQVVVTHSHADHYGGLASLIDNIAIGEILVGRLDGEPEYVMMLSRARAKGIRVRTIKAGDRWQSGRASVTVLHPQEADPGPGADPNSESVVLRVELGEFALLLTGDVTPEVGRDLAWGDAGAAHADAIDPGVPERSLACTVLKAPHHGAPNSLDRDFLARCGASIAVVSAGSKWASHPSPATIEMLKASGALTLVTSTDGAVSLVTDGNVVDLKTQSGIDLTLAARRAPD